MINQLFIDKPPSIIILQCIILLGWTSLSDNRIIMRTDLDNLQIADKFINIIQELRQYYLPCKQDKYLSNINTKSVITIVRQLLKTINYNIKGIEKVIDNKKEMIYKLEQYTKIYNPLQNPNPNSQTPNTNSQTNSQFSTQINIHQNNMITHTNPNKFIVCWN